MVESSATLRILKNSINKDRTMTEQAKAQLRLNRTSEFTDAHFLQTITI